MRYAVTGHRPNKLDGYGKKQEARLILFARDFFNKNVTQEDVVITGMAIGWDQAVAEACLALDIPYIAAVPFEGQEERWPEEVQSYYDHLIRHAKEVHVVSEGGYSPVKMHVRNEWMVHNCDILISLFDGIPNGGTYSCVNYAKKKGKPIQNLWDDWLNFK